MARQFIYHMQGLGKTYPGGKNVLENINLSFYPDAKIGVRHSDRDLISGTASEERHEHQTALRDAAAVAIIPPASER